MPYFSRYHHFSLQVDTEMPLTLEDIDKMVNLFVCVSSNVMYYSPIFTVFIFIFSGEGREGEPSAKEG